MRVIGGRRKYRLIPLRMAELADARDLKSLLPNGEVSVRIRLPGTKMLYSLA